MKETILINTYENFVYLLDFYINFRKKAASAINKSSKFVDQCKATN